MRSESDLASLFSDADVLDSSLEDELGSESDPGVNPSEYVPRRRLSSSSSCKRSKRPRTDKNVCFDEHMHCSKEDFERIFQSLDPLQEPTQPVIFQKRPKSKSSSESAIEAFSKPSQENLVKLSELKSPSESLVALTYMRIQYGDQTPVALMEFLMPRPSSRAEHDHCKLLRERLQCPDFQMAIPGFLTPRVIRAILEHFTSAEYKLDAWRYICCALPEVPQKPWSLADWKALQPRFRSLEITRCYFHKLVDTSAYSFVDLLEWIPTVDSECIVNFISKLIQNRALAWKDYLKLLTVVEDRRVPLGAERWVENINASTLPEDETLFLTQIKCNPVLQQTNVIYRSALMFADHAKDVTSELISTCFPLLKKAECPHLNGSTLVLFFQRLLPRLRTEDKVSSTKWLKVLDSDIDKDSRTKVIQLLRQAYPDDVVLQDAWSKDRHGFWVNSQFVAAEESKGETVYRSVERSMYEGTWTVMVQEGNVFLLSGDVECVRAVTGGASGIKIRYGLLTGSKAIVRKHPPRKPVDDSDKCIICLDDRNRLGVFSPCGHRQCCLKEECYLKIEVCPLCRAPSMMIPQELCHPTQEIYPPEEPKTDKSIQM